MRGGPETATRARAAVAASFAAQGLGFAVLVTHLPDFTERYRLSELAVTLLLFGVTVLAGVGSVTGEALAGHTSSGTALRVALAAAAAGLTIAALAPSLPAALPGFALYGLAVGGVDATSNMQAVAVQHEYGRSIITSFHACWSGAAIAGALLVAGGGAAGLGSSGLDLAATILPVAAVVLAVASLTGPYLLVAGPPVVEHPGGEPGGVVPLRPLLLLGVALTCFWAVDSGIANWSALYLDDGLAAGSAAALGYAGYQVTALLSRIGGDLAVRRFGSVTTVRCSGAVGVAGLLVVLAAPSAPWAVLGFALTGVGLPVVAPLCFSATAAAVRGRGGDAVAVDRAIARLNVFNYAGSLVGAVAVGGVGAAGSLRWGFAVPLLLAAGVVALAPAFRPDDA